MQNLSRENTFYLHENQKSWIVLSLAFNQRIGATRKWSIVSWFVYCNAFTQFVPSSLLSTHYVPIFSPNISLKIWPTKMNHFASLRTNTRLWKSSLCLYKKNDWKEKWRVKRTEANCVFFCFCLSFISFSYYSLFYFFILYYFTFYPWVFQLSMYCTPVLKRCIRASLSRSRLF